jgi:hypothetical protein
VKLSKLLQNEDSLVLFLSGKRFRFNILAAQVSRVQNVFFNICSASVTCKLGTLSD